MDAVDEPFIKSTSKVHKRERDRHLRMIYFRSCISMTTTSWISITGLVLQGCLFGGLIWYCVETQKIRIIAGSQLEALQAPCLTFWATPRDAGDAVLEMDGAQGAMILNFISGDAVLLNIGNGPAVNVSYVLRPLGDARSTPQGYVSSIPPSARASVPVPRGILAGHRYDCSIRYESLTGTKYETKLSLHNLVLTPPFEFSRTRP